MDNKERPRNEERKKTLLSRWHLSENPYPQVPECHDLTICVCRRPSLSDALTGWQTVPVRTWYLEAPCLVYRLCSQFFCPDDRRKTRLSFLAMISQTRIRPLHMFQYFHLHVIRTSIFICLSKLDLLLKPSWATPAVSRSLSSKVRSSSIFGSIMPIKQQEKWNLAGKVNFFLAISSDFQGSPWLLINGKN